MLNGNSIVQGSDVWAAVRDGYSVHERDWVQIGEHNSYSAGTRHKNVAVVDKWPNWGDQNSLATNTWVCYAANYSPYYGVGKGVTCLSIVSQNNLGSGLLYPENCFKAITTSD